MFLSTACPLAGFFLIAQTLLKAVQYVARKTTITTKHKIDARKCETELGVFITGCDSGFGKALALDLEEKGFIIFAACLTQKGMDQFSMNKKIVPIQMDVTNNEQVLQASEVVSQWLNKKGKNIVLHAVVNNAGVGSFGFVDWQKLSSYERDMEVNYFGMVQTTKAFLPILKNQVYKNLYKNSRIINIISAAGIVIAPSFSTYNASKFAAEGFTSGLRIELLDFDIQVVSVNPSFHKTPLTSDENTEKQAKKTWDGMSPEMRTEYGEKFYQAWLENFSNLIHLVMWKPEVAIDEIVASIEAVSPNPQLLLGTDAKYIFSLQKSIPLWLQTNILKTLEQFSVKPAKLVTK